MRNYYRGPDVLITDRVFVVLAPAPVWYRIDEIQDARVVRGDLPPVRVLTAHFAAAAIVLLAIGWPFLHAPVAYLTAIVTVMVSCIAAGVCWRLAPRAYELRATYRKFEVCLFESTDERVFGQVRRGLLRALEGRGNRLEAVFESGFGDSAA